MAFTHSTVCSVKKTLKHSLCFTFVPHIIRISHSPPVLITLQACLTAARDEFVSWKEAKKTCTQLAHFLFQLFVLSIEWSGGSPADVLA